MRRTFATAVLLTAGLLLMAAAPAAAFLGIPTPLQGADTNEGAIEQRERAD